MIRKVRCEKHEQSLFYIYIDDETGRIGTMCQVCEDEAIVAQQEKIRKKHTREM